MEKYNKQVKLNEDLNSQMTGLVGRLGNVNVMGTPGDTVPLLLVEIEVRNKGALLACVVAQSAVAVSERFLREAGRLFPGG